MMKLRRPHPPYLAVATVLALGAGCSTPATTTSRAIQGQFVVSSYALDNARVVAHADDGTLVYATLDRAGRFLMRLPVGVGYTVALANTRSDGGLREISTLGFPVGAARRSHFELGAGDTIDLGTIRPVGAPLGATSKGADDPAGDDHGGASTAGSDDNGSLDDDAISACVASGRSDLPYDVRPALGATFQLSDAFLLRGPKPPTILAVELNGTTSRATELANDSVFTIEASDCSHAGNRDVGRDRVFVRWQNADGTVDEDHLDLRYCKSASSSSSNMPVGDSGCMGAANDDVCVDAVASQSGCSNEHPEGVQLGAGSDDRKPCDDHVTATAPSPHDLSSGSSCTMNEQCGTHLDCVASTCQPEIL